MDSGSCLSVGAQVAPSAVRADRLRAPGTRAGSSPRRASPAPRTCSRARKQRGPPGGGV